MKKGDLTGKIMDRVVRFERQRTYQWFGMFILVVLFLGGVVAIGFFLTYKQTMSMQTWELLAIFREDQEIIREFWTDVVSTIFLELPYQFIFLFTVGLLVGIGVIIATRKKRTIMKHKISSIKSYSERRLV